MLIGILSDTHDNIEKTGAAVTLFNREGVEMVLHAGDYVAPFMIKTLAGLKAPMTGVFGNNDGDRPLLLQMCAKHEHMEIAGNFAGLDADGVRIALMHGHEQRLLEAFAGCSCVNVLVYGHTHRPEVRKEGKTLIVNPGEVYGYLTGKSTVALLDTKKMDAEIVVI